MVTSIVGDHVETRAPSEPVLALAAAWRLNESQEIYRNALNVLIDELVLEDSVVDRDDLNSLYTRLLFILARDRAAINVCGGLLDGTKTRVIPLTLDQFLVTLTGPNFGFKYTDQYTSSTPVLEELHQFCATPTLHFTHFHLLPQPLEEIPIRMLEWAWSIGAAFQFSYDQTAIRKVIPMYFGDLDEPYNARKLGCLVVHEVGNSDGSGGTLGDFACPPVA